MNPRKETFSLSKRIKSFSYALNGLKYLVKYEHNSRIHLIATILVGALGFLLQLQYYEWGMVLFCIGIVWITEILNTAIEKLCDFQTLEQHPKIKVIKDLCAGAVLISAIISLIIGLLIFLPKLYVLYS